MAYESLERLESGGEGVRGEGLRRGRTDEERALTSRREGSEERRLLSALRGLRGIGGERGIGERDGLCEL
jgi:hypothetical protein